MRLPPWLRAVFATVLSLVVLIGGSPASAGPTPHVRPLMAARAPLDYDSGPLATAVTSLTAVGSNGLKPCVLSGGTGGTVRQLVAFTYGKALIQNVADNTKTFTRAKCGVNRPDVSIASTVYGYTIGYALFASSTQVVEGGSDYVAPFVGTYGANNKVSSATMGAAHQGVGLGDPNHYILSHDNPPYLVMARRADATVTVTDGGGSAPGVWTWTGHGLSVGDLVMITSTGALPTGLTSGVLYCVKTAPTADTFTLAASACGTAINTTGTGTGTHTARKVDNVKTTAFPSPGHTGPPRWYPRTVSGVTNPIVISGSNYNATPGQLAIHFVDPSVPGMNVFKSVNVSYASVPAAPSGQNTDKPQHANGNIKLGAASDGSQDIIYLSSYWNETVAYVLMSDVLAAANGGTVSAHLLGFFPTTYKDNKNDGLLYDAARNLVVVSGDRTLIMDASNGQFRGEFTGGLSAGWGSGGDVDVLTGKYGMWAVLNGTTNVGVIDFVDPPTYPMPTGSAGLQAYSRGIRFNSITIPTSVPAFTIGAVTIPKNITASTFLRLSDMTVTSGRPDMIDTHIAGGFLQSDMASSKWRTPGPTDVTTTRASPNVTPAVNTRYIYGLTWDDAQVAGSKGNAFAYASDASGAPTFLALPGDPTPANDRKAWPTNGGWLSMSGQLAANVMNQDVGLFAYVKGPLTTAQVRELFGDNPAKALNDNSPLTETQWRLLEAS